MYHPHFTTHQIVNGILYGIITVILLVVAGLYLMEFLSLR